MQQEIRQNKLTGEWVICAPDRGERPDEMIHKQNEERGQETTSEDDCPFCPGHEKMLPGIVMSLPSTQQWQTRVVPNKFPALSPDHVSERAMDGIYLKMPGYGRHEVIIEHPDHACDLATMTTEEVGTIIETYHQRYYELMKTHENMLCLIFRNHGERSGASLTHPHSQIIVTGVVPRHIRWREHEAQRYFDAHGRCSMCDILIYETQNQRRIIQTNDSFAAFVPYAAEVPFEVWIVPLRHQASFGNISDVEKQHLAQILRAMLRLLRTRLHDPDYNYIIHSAAQYRAGEPQLHWYMQIRPRLVTPAGFEIGSGIHINPSLPEENAEFLKKT